MRLRWLLTLIWTVGAQNLRPVQLLLYSLPYQSEGISISTSRRFFSLLPSFDFSNIIMVDMNCGDRLTNCPKYCNNTDFAEFYCSHRCFPTTPQTIALTCGRKTVWSRFSGDSPTARRLNRTEWTVQTLGFRRMFGDFWSERYNLTGSQSESDRIETELQLVAASLFDIRALSEQTQGIFGLAPGGDGAVPQLARRHQLPHAVMSSSWSRWSLRGKRLYSRILTVGALDRARCVDWEFVQSVSPDKWVFEIDEIEMSGIRIQRKILATFVYEQGYVYMGTPVAAALEASGAISYHHTLNYEDIYLANEECTFSRRDQLKIHFRSGALKFTLSGASIVKNLQTAEGRWKCELGLIVNKRNLHHNAEVLIFGSEIMKDVCTAFDYENNRIGFAKLRKWHFPYKNEKNPIY